MFIPDIKIIKNISLLLLFTFLSLTLLFHHRKMKVEGAWSEAAYTAVSLTPQPTLTLLSRPKASLTTVPTASPFPTSVPPTAIPTVQPQAVITTVSANDLITKLNEFRKSKGLSEVTSDSKTCDFAKIRLNEIITNFSHDGFQQRIDSHSLPYPSYTNVVENLAQLSSPSKNVIDMWINSPSHRENMEKDTPYVCIEQLNGFYVYEGWKP